jgi:hypothetical protein
VAGEGAVAAVSAYLTYNGAPTHITNCDDIHCSGLLLRWCPARPAMFTAALSRAKSGKLDYGLTATATSTAATTAMSPSPFPHGDIGHMVSYIFTYCGTRT